MDKSMPVMDGIEATQEIRSRFGQNFMVIGLTGDAIGEDLQAFLSIGLDDVLGKPAGAKEVHSCVESLLRQVDA